MAEEVGVAITGVGDHGALNNTNARTDGEYADELFKQHEDGIHVTRKESYLSAANLLRLKEAKEGKKEVEWDKLTPEQLADVLASNMTTGLSEAEAKSRHEKDGANELEKPKRPTLAMLFLLQILNLIIMLLVIAAFASLIVSGTGINNKDPISYVDSISIFIIVIINAGIGAVTENSAAGALEALSKLSQPKATVIRDGKELQVASTKLVKGDVLLLTVGDIVPADVRLIEADDLKVNEMLLTGEPDDVSKFARMKKKGKGGDDDGHGGGEKLTPENMAFSSCMCTNGKTRAFIVEIGMFTRVGRIAKLLSESDSTPVQLTEEQKAKFEETGVQQQPKKKGSWCPCLPDMTSNQTPLQRSLQALGVKIGVFAIIGCVIVFIVGIGRKVYDIDEPDLHEYGDVVIYMVLVSVTLAVAAIPEGIPLCVTISLSTGCSDMVKQHVLVRRIAAVETLGCASVICTDKTGTLTEGKMTLVKMWASGEDFDVSGKGFDPTVGKITYKGTQKEATASIGVNAALTSAVLCCNTKVVHETDPDDGTKKWVPYGNSSEAPLIVAGLKVAKDAAKLGTDMPRIYEVPFSSSRKMMLTVCQMKGTSGSNEVAKSIFPGFFQGKTPEYLANVKGAPNFILKDCDSWTDPEGKVRPLTEEDKAKIMKRVDELSSEALRVLAVAARPVDSMPFDHTDKDLEWSTDQKFESLIKQPGLVLLGLVASIDPERDGVPQAVLDAQGGHIRVVMITGDYLPTAIAIGHNCNILLRDDDEASCALDCGKLRPTGEYITDDEIDYLTKTVKVFARAQPEDKLQIVKSLQRQGLVSAMTGDGVNDAPALKRANIGVAMGIQGTEVAKGASDMILTDDNFCSIVKAVEKGRIIYAGIQKFVCFILSVHLAEVAQIFICIVANIPIMRTPLQILFLILVTDLPPSVALGMERVARDILKDMPRPKKQPIVMGWQWQGIVANALILTLSTLCVYIWALHYFMDNTYSIPDIAHKICDGECKSKDQQLNVYWIQQLQYARTTAFISLVYSENIRAYTSRNFSAPVWVDMCSNTAMQKAIGFAQIALYVAVFVPGLSETILELRGKDIGGVGWGAAIIGGLVTVTLCELYKFVTRSQVLRNEKMVIDMLQKQEEERLKMVEQRRQEHKSKPNGNGHAAEQPAAKA